MDSVFDRFGSSEVDFVVSRFGDQKLESKDGVFLASGLCPGFAEKFGTIIFENTGYDRIISHSSHQDSQGKVAALQYGSPH